MHTHVAAVGIYAVSGGPSSTWDYEDDIGRLETVSSAGATHTHTYADGTNMLTGLTTTEASSTVLTRTLHHDRMQRLIGIETKNGTGTTLSRHGYTLDAAGRMTKATRENGQRWDYGYDPLGQVTSAVKKFPDSAAIPGNTFSYQFDGIGNRTSAVQGGTGTAVTYPASQTNALNQYTSIITEGGRFVLGEAPAANEVTVNGSVASRAGGLGFYWKQITGDNSIAPLWSNDTVTSNGITISGNTWTPMETVTPVHDFDGNLTFDGRWDYTWDAENRLTSMETTTDAANAGVPRQRLDFVYDSQSRRISKTVSTSADGINWTFANNYRYLYDDWNLIAEYSVPSATSTTLTLETTHTWGIDLSGTMQGAGGVGGLLSSNIQNSTSNIACYPAYDGNGNISAWIDSNGALLARMDYSPFGELIAQYKFTGDATLSRLRFGFSTKFTDAESGLLYYGYRYYDPTTGRWPSRDPIGERGGINLYGFVGNNGVDRWDHLGLTTWTTDFGILENDAGFWSVLNHAINTWENLNPLGAFGRGQGRDYFTDIKYLGIGPSVTSGGADGNLKDQHPGLFTKVCAMKEGGSVQVNHDINNWFSDQRPWTIGHISLRIFGSLTKICPHGQNMWKFIGSATAYPDKFDFNQMHRVGVTTKKDIGIGILDFLQRNSSRWFYIKPQGAASFKDIGSCK